MTARLLAIAALLAVAVPLSGPEALRLLVPVVPALAGILTLAIVLAGLAVLAARLLSPSTPWYPLAALWRRLLVVTMQPVPGWGTA